MSDYKNDLKIDKFNLDREWEAQPLLYMKWAEAHAQAILERDKAKERLDVVRAELDSEIRREPEKFGFDKKPTESAISNAIVQQERYKEAYSKLVKATESMNILAGAREAMAHKKKALENITQLMIAGYYAEPNIPKELKEKRMEEVESDLKKSLSGNRRLRRTRK